MKRPRALHPIDPPDRSVAYAVLLLVLAIYTATFSGLPGNVDAEVSFQTTSALWREHTFALGSTPEAEGLIEYSRSVPPGAFSVREGAGPGADRYYGWFGIGHALVALPFYGAGRLARSLVPSTEEAHQAHRRHGVYRSEYFEHLFVGWRNALFGALTAMVVTLAVLRLGRARKTAFLAGMGYGLATFAWPQARAGLSDVQATLFVALALYSLLLLRERQGWLPALVFGLGLGLAFLTRVALAPAVIVLDGAWLWIALRGRRQAPPRRTGFAASVWLPIVVPQGIAVLAWLYFNQLRFGDMLDGGYGPALAGGLFGGHPGRAFAGLLFSPGKGILWMAPGVLLLFFGFGQARRWGMKVFVTTCLALALAVFLPAVLLRGWHGAWTFGPRYLLPALPALWILAAIGFERSDVDSRPRPLTMALLAGGLLIQVPGVLVDTMTYHELAIQAAPGSLPVAAELEGADRDEELFQALQFDWGFAAPWVHWRILRHRIAGRGEEFEVTELFRGATTEARLVPAQERERGFGHLAWRDLSERLGGSIWPALALILVLLGAGSVSAVRGLDPS